MKIGFFDSGIGGLSVLHEAYHLLPGQDCLFYADEDHVPYGLKSEEEITSYAISGAMFLKNHGVEAIVVACNTATAVAIEELRRMLDIPVIGMEPAVKPAVEGGQGDRVLVIATPVTIRESKLRNLIRRVDEQHRVDLLPLPELVGLAEAEAYDAPEAKAYLENALKGYDPANYDALVLGCTHFNYFKPSFHKIFRGGVSLIDGNQGTIRRLADLTGQAVHEDETSCSFRDLSEMNQIGRTSYFVSGRLVTDEETLLHYLRLHNRLEEVRKLRS